MAIGQAMIRIRRMRLDDLDEVHRIGMKTKEFSLSRETRFYKKRHIRNWIKNPHHDVLLVAERVDKISKDKKIIGFVFSKLMKNSWAELYNLVVVPEFRGKGIAGQLLKECIKRIKRFNVDYVCGLVGTKYMKSRKFWKKQGFKEGYEFVWIQKFL